MIDYNVILGQRLQNLMESDGINQLELADRTFVSNSAISLYVLGKRFPRPDTLIQFCEIFGVSMDYLFGLSDNRYQSVTPNNATKEIPILKTLHSTDGIFNNPDNIERILTVIARNYKHPDKLFGIRAKTDNMLPRIYPKDLLICEMITPNDTFESGDICIVTAGDNEAVAREITPNDNGFYFNPYNTTIPPKFYSWDEMREKQINIIARVIEMRKNFEC